MPKIPDYTKLHNDFDRRINLLEKVEQNTDKDILSLERHRHETDQKFGKGKFIDHN